MKQIVQYIGFVWKRNQTIFIFSLIFIAAIQFFVIQFMSTIDMDPLRKMMQALPKAIQSLIGEEMMNKLSVEGSAAFAFTHPITFGMFSYLAISIPIKEVTRSIEVGEMEVMLSYPITRKKLLSSIWIAGIIMLLLVTCGAVLSSIAALHFYQNTGWSTAFKMIKIGHNLFTIFFFVFSFSMLIAVMSMQYSKATTRAVAITAGSYLVMVLAQIWHEIDWTKRFNFFNYFDPHQIINNKGNYLWQVFDLTVLCLVFYFVSLYLFKKKDI